MGDRAFVAFLRDYYNRWALRHVDGRAMRASAERAYGADLGWFFDQWLRGTGLLDYGVGAATTVRSADNFITRVRVTRLGALRHPMPVGIHTARGWTIGRSKPELDDQWVDIPPTTAAPDSIALDPFHVTWDWDWRDNTQQSWVGTVHAPDVVFDWPFLDPSKRTRTVVAWAPRLWYSGPQGLIGGIGVRTNYVGMTDIHNSVVAIATRTGREPNGSTPSAPSVIHFRVQADDVYLAPFMVQPLMGVRGGVAYLDGIARADFAKRWDLSPFAFAKGPKVDASVGMSAAFPLEPLLLPEQWSNVQVTELIAAAHYRAPAAADSQTTVASLDGGIGYAGARDATARSGAYGRVLASIENVSYLTPDVRTLTLRLNAGFAQNAPLQRSIFASSRDPWETFTNDYFRPRGAAFKQEHFTIVPLGGARLRGFTPLLGLKRVVSANVEASQKLTTWTGSFGRLVLWGGPFVDAGTASASTMSPALLIDHFLVDAGVGIAIRGKFYDRAINMRVDAPLVVNRPVTPARLGRQPSGIRWAVSW